MAIIHRHNPDAKLDETQSDIIQTKRFTAMDARGDSSTISTF
jgi:hypothetical protein